MADGRRCYNCGGHDHIKRYCPHRHLQRSCPRTQCFSGQQFGHRRANCPVINQQFPQSQGRRHESSGNTVKSTRASEKTPASPSASSSKAVTSFFQRYPTTGRRPWLGLCRSGSKPASTLPPPFLPHMDKDFRSNIRSAETVKRVSETIYQMIGDNGGDPLQIFVNKNFTDFSQGKNSPLLCFPEGEADLKKGDFDIIVVCRGSGYVYVEVKAFGDAQEDLDEAQKVTILAEKLEKAVNELRKGRKALEHLQPVRTSVKIINTLALPNVTRQFVSSVLQQDPQLRSKLAKCMTGETREEVSVEDLVLCADDLPPKDGEVDVSDERVRTAITRWWSAITRIGASTPIRSDAYKLILASFFNNEDVKDFTECVQHIGEMFRKPQLDERQVSLASSGKQYVYVTGPPGSGKTLVLAEKSAQWLHVGQSVFVLFARKTITNQPATACLLHFINAISSEYSVPSSRLHNIDISNFGQPDDVLTDILKIRDNPRLGEVRPIHKPEDYHFQEVERTKVKLSRVFSSDALKDTPTTETDASAESGHDICIVIDEFHMRTVCGETTNFFKRIQKRFPAAKIWCAGPFRGHQPAPFFCTEELLLPYRCPPKTQKLLEALEPFCRNEERPVFSYVTSSTEVPSAGMAPHAERHYRLPEDGPDPVFFSHADHGPGEITDCRKCAQTLSDYLKHDLRIGHKNSGRVGKLGLQESDVLIVVSSTMLYNNMQSLRHYEMFRQLVSENFNINIYGIRDTYRQDRPGLCVMHARLVAGMERKVVVSIPCQQYQHQAQKMTYAEVVRCPVASGEPRLTTTASGRGPRGGGAAVSGLSSPAPGPSVPRPGPSPPAPAQRHQGQCQGQSRQSSNVTAPVQGQSRQSPNPTALVQGHQGQGQSTQSPNATALVQGHRGQSTQSPNATALVQGHQGQGQSSQSPNPSSLPGGGLLDDVLSSVDGDSRPTAAAVRVSPMREDAAAAPAAAAADLGSSVVQQGEISDFLQGCPTLTQSQRERLCRLGRLNLHWLWYSASRSLAHNVIFHF